MCHRHVTQMLEHLCPVTCMLPTLRILPFIHYDYYMHVTCMLVNLKGEPKQLSKTILEHPNWPASWGVKCYVHSNLMKS